MTRSAADVLADLAALAMRQAELTAELGRALLASAPAPARPSVETPEYLTTQEAAVLLGVSAKHLESLRANGRGPAFVRIGHAVRYPREGLCKPTS